MLYVFPGIDTSTLLKELQSGLRLPNPTLSPPNISHIMQSCWLADPTERPTFSKTRDALFKELQHETEKRNNYQDYLSRLESGLGEKQYKSIRETNSKTSDIQKNISEHDNTNAMSNIVPETEQIGIDDTDRPENNQNDVIEMHSSLNLSRSFPFIDDDIISINTDWDQAIQASISCDLPLR